MALNADTLLDRLYLKSQVTKWRIAAIVAAVFALIIFLDRYSQHSPIDGDFVARLSIEGVITDDQEFYTLIDDITENPNAKAVIVWIDTPGGSAVGGEEIYNRLRLMAKKKPVVAVMRQIAASAGYMVALGSDHIIAREGTITGSIGVLIETAEVTDLAQKIGIKPILIKSTPLKGSPNPLEKSSPEAERVLYDVINDFYNRFVDMVSERRNLPRGLVVSLADGRVYSGKRALESKLIDALGGEEEAMQYLAEKRKIAKDLEIQDVEVDPKTDWLSAVSEDIAGKFFQNSRLGLDGISAIWHPSMQ